MNRAWRRRVNRLADALEGAAEFLRRKAERPIRHRPLAFPTKGEEMMQEIMSLTLRHFANDRLFSAGTIWDAPRMMRAEGQLYINRTKAPEDCQ